MIVGPDGKPVTVTEVVVGTKPPTPSRRVTRQLIRAYMRKAAMSYINQKFGPEPRRIRRMLALARAKNKAFIDEVRSVTKAW